MKQESPSENLFHYLHWRGDLSFAQAPFCPVDNLIFCCLSYLNWGIPASGSTPETAITLKDAAAYWEHLPESLQQTRVPLDLQLLQQAANSTRFGSVRLFRYVESFQEQQEQQFSATTFLLDNDTAYVAFRGTDNTLVGWKEDFNMSFQSEVPSQTAAAAYLQEFSALSIHHILVGGHSKGGNLAVFAAVKAPPVLQARIQAVYNNDGPGFCSDILHSIAYYQILHKVHTFVPEASIVGMLLEHEEDYQVIASTQHGFLQHDPYSWCVNGADWYYLPETSSTSQRLDASLKHWIASMQPAERERMVDTIFHLLRSQTNAETIQDLLNGGTSTIFQLLRTWSDTPLETREFMQKMLFRLFTMMRQKRNALPDSSNI